MRAGFVLPLALFGVLAAVFGTYLYQVGPGGKDISTVPSALIDKPVPFFALPPLDDRAPTFGSDDLNGQVTLVNVFASWCLPCRAEHPVLMRLARDGIAVYGINIKDAPKDAKAFLDELGNPYRRLGTDRSGRVSIDWGVYGYPETFVVDRAGRIRYRHVGPIMPRDLDAVILPLVRRLSG